MDTLAPFRQALENLRAEIEQKKAERAHAQQQVEACDQHLEEMQAEYQGIESYVRRHRQQDQQEVEDEPASEPAGGPADGWDIDRTEAVARVLSESEEPMSPGDIVKALAQVGRDDSMKDVAAALTHLKLKRHRAMNVSRGRWIATTEALEEAWGDEEVSNTTTTTMH
jgi:multidrug resistance efflux pump